jgi:hypothetical protein
LCSLVLIGQSVVPALAANSQPELKFKIYSPSGGGSSQESAPAAEDKGDGGFWTDAQQPADQASDAQEAAPAAPAESTSVPKATPAASASPAPDSSSQAGTSSATTEAASTTPTTEAAAAATEAAPADKTELKSETPTEDTQAPAAHNTTATAGKQVLQGYVRVVPVGTKIPIIMDTAVDSDTSQEGDEFSARTSEDLNVDGTTVVPAGSVIKGRIAALNAPRALMRSGSVALKFDSVTTPDNRQIPLVANIVARGGVVHARRGLKDIAIDTGTVALPLALGLGIGAIAGNASKNNGNTGDSNGSGIGTAGGALIGAGIGIAIGAIILCAKKGKKVDVRPGDELKIELAEDLRMPM